MSQVTFKGTNVQLYGNFPKVGASAPDFSLVTNDLKEVSLKDFTEKNIILNIFPSVDTQVCALSVRNFNAKIVTRKDTIVLCISKDLPFAQARFCDVTDIHNVQTLSAFRSPNFGSDYGVGIKDYPLKELLARAVIVLDAGRKVIYTELVPEITHEPDYEACFRSLLT